MINNKVKYITKELPLIESKINSYNEQLTKLLDDEKSIQPFKEKWYFWRFRINYKRIKFWISKKGEYEAVIVRIEESEKQIKIIENNISDINNEIMSEEYQQDVKTSYWI